MFAPTAPIFTVEKREGAALQGTGLRSGTTAHFAEVKIVFLSRNLGQNVAALWIPPLNPAFVVLIYCTVATFNQRTILGLTNTLYYCHKKEQTALNFHIKFYSFCWWGGKIFLLPDARYSSYATDFSSGYAIDKI